MDEFISVKKRSRLPLLFSAGIVILAVIVGLFFLLRPPPPCSVQSAEFIASFDPLIDRWNDAFTIANSTSRIALSPAVAELQSIKRDIEALTPPECAITAHAMFISQADYVIDGFLSFMSDDEDRIVNSYFDTALTRLKDFGDLYQQVKTAP